MLGLDVSAFFLLQILLSALKGRVSLYEPWFYWLKHWGPRASFAPGVGRVLIGKGHLGHPHELADTCLEY